MNSMWFFSDARVQHCADVARLPLWYRVTCIAISPRKWRKALWFGRVAIHFIKADDASVFDPVLRQSDELWRELFNLPKLPPST
jgi:hypothetical protein